MKIEQIYKLIENIEIGEVFQHDDSIWIKTNSSHETAGFQCVELSRGNLVYLKRGEEVTQVDARLQVFTPIPSNLQGFRRTVMTEINSKEEALVKEAQEAFANAFPSIREGLKDICRHMLTCSRYNNLDDAEFNRQIGDIFTYLKNQIEQIPDPAVNYMDDWLRGWRCCKKDILLKLQSS